MQRVCSIWAIKDHFFLYPDSTGELWPYVLVVYKFDGVPEHTVLVHPHGNVRGDKPYQRTIKSTKQHLENELQVRRPKDAVYTIFESKGGLVGARSAGSFQEALHKPIT